MSKDELQKPSYDKTGHDIQKLYFKTYQQIKVKIYILQQVL